MFDSFLAARRLSLSGLHASGALVSGPLECQKAGRICFNRQNRGFSRGAAGFTLLELLVVMVIIGMLAAYVGPRYFSQLAKSEQGIAKAQIESFAKALDTYRLDTGGFPSTEEGLNALMVKPVQTNKWNGPYLQKGVPLDPWGHGYVYKAPGNGKDFDLVSYGKDGQPGGTGDATDISN